MTVIVCFVVISIVSFNKYIKHKLKNDNLKESRYDLLNIQVFIKETFNDILRVNLYEMNLSRVEFDKKMHNKNQLRKALKDCTYGDLKAKQYIKHFIRDILTNKYMIDENNIDEIIPFNRIRKLSVQDKFEIILHDFKKKHGYQALEQMVETYHLAEAKAIDSGIQYMISESDINNIYEHMMPVRLNFADKMAVVTQRLYQHYKGYGVIDDIRDMHIDGVSGGVSGIPASLRNVHKQLRVDDFRGLPYNYDSIWMFYKGKTIHLAFLSFGSERELIRVCKNIYRYNKPGQLSESNGYKINEMKDGSRVVVARPPFSESWVFFVRKFDSCQKKALPELIVDKGNHLPIQLIKWLIKGARVTAITGSQGTGKTTLLMAVIGFINHAYTLRIQETAFELNLRKEYPYRNIVTFRETSTISGQEGLDLQKKTDGTVNILGEVATAPIASLMIQMAQVASLFTLFTHHAKTSEHLIYALRNNLLQTKVFSNEKVAEQQVADVINFDIHMEKDVDGHRYIERITEIIPVDFRREYNVSYKNAESQEERKALFMDTMAEYFQRMTDRQTFETRDIIRFKDGEYIWVNDISEKSRAEIMKYLWVNEQDDFNEFLGRMNNEA